MTLKKLDLVYQILDYQAANPEDSKKTTENRTHSQNENTKRINAQDGPRR